MRAVVPSAKISTVLVGSPLQAMYCFSRHLRTKGIRSVIREPAPHRYVLRVAPKDIARAKRIIRRNLGCR